MKGPLVFIGRDGTKVKLDEAVIERLAAFRQVRPKDTEAGGVLLGRHLLESPHKVVDDLTCPMPGDKRARFEFKRGQANHQRRIDDTWTASGGTCVYLGEWHTHPEPVPTPSSIDMCDWRRRLQTDKFDGDTLYFAIVGIRVIRVWEGRRRGLAISHLEAINVQNDDSR